MSCNNHLTVILPPRWRVQVDPYNPGCAAVHAATAPTAINHSIDCTARGSPSTCLLVLVIFLAHNKLRLITCLPEQMECRGEQEGLREGQGRLDEREVARG